MIPTTQYVLGRTVSGTVRNWVKDDRGPGFASQYRIARELQTALLSDEVIYIADDSFNDRVPRTKAHGEVEHVPNYENIERARPQICGRTWHLGRLSRTPTGSGSGRRAVAAAALPASTPPASDAAAIVIEYQRLMNREEV